MSSRSRAAVRRLMESSSSTLTGPDSTPPCPTREAFYTAACVLLDLPLPRFERPLRRPLAQYDVGRLRADLLPTPAHPRWQGALVPG